MKNRHYLIFGFVMIASFLQGQDHIVVDAPAYQNPNEPTVYISTRSDTVDANYYSSLSQIQRDSSLASSFVALEYSSCCFVISWKEMD